MGRPSRYFFDGELSSYHIISRIAGGEFKLGDEDKEYFVNLMFQLSRGYYVDIISYTVMSNHFHILIGNRVEEALGASEDELIEKYKLSFGEDARHPEGGYIQDGYEIDYDEDGGTERLRRRLGSASRFLQDLKQRFSKWYNFRHKRRGGLWGARFKGIAISKGDAELICSAYIDLNSLRAGVVEKPEDYRWSSIGLKARIPKKAGKLLKNIELEEETDSRVVSELTFPLYRAFIYDAGRIEKDGTARISKDIYQKSQDLCFKFSVGDSLRYRYRNITEGIGFGTGRFIAELQEKLGRKFIKPRKVTENRGDEEGFFSTRKLKPL